MSFTEMVLRLCPVMCCSRADVLSRSAMSEYAAMGNLRDESDGRLAVTHDEGTIAEPTNYKLDKSRDWALYGELLERRGGTWLKFTTRIPVEGAVVRIDDSARSWRVQKRRRDSVDLIVTDRRASHRGNAVDIGKVQVLSTEDSECKVFSPGDVVTTIRAFGEPPGCGAPLILSEGGVWSCAVGDRASLNEFTGAELAGMRQAALTDDEIVSMIGNCAPRKLVLRPLEAITRIMMDCCPMLGLAGDVDNNETDADGGADATAQQGGGSTGSMQALVVVPVLPKLHSVVLGVGKSVRTLKSGVLSTGKLLQAAKQSLGGELDGELLVPAGSWLQGGLETFVIAHVAAEIPEGMTAYSLNDLAGTEAYHVASLALAKIESHSGGHTTVEQILPMLDATGRYKVGALAAKRLDPPTVCNGVCTWTRTQALAHCRAVEARVAAGRGAAAAEEEQQDTDLSDYLKEWMQQVTITDLKDVPDELLQQMPVFDDPVLLRQKFSHTTALPMTDAVRPPANTEPSFAPESEADLFKADSSVLAERDEAEAELVEFFKLLWNGDLDDKQPAQARPEPRCLGNEHMAEGAQWTVWDLTGDKPVPVDFSRDSSSKRWKVGPFHCCILEENECSAPPLWDCHSLRERPRAWRSMGCE